MSDLRKAAEMALEFVEWLCGDDHSVKPKNSALKTREALRQALEQPEQEPETVMAKYEFHIYAAYKTDGEIKIGVVPEHTAWVTAGKHTVQLYTAPPKREWVGLTDEELMEMLDYGQCGRVPQYARNFVDGIEAKLKEKNT